MNSNNTVFESSTGFRVALDTENEQLSVTSDSAVQLRIDLRTGEVQMISDKDIAMMSGGRISLDAAKGIDVRTGGDLQLIAEGETIVRGKVVRIN